jgi:hypothetical protein
MATLAQRRQSPLGIRTPVESLLFSEEKHHEYLETDTDWIAVPLRPPTILTTAFFSSSSG